MRNDIRKSSDEPLPKFELPNFNLSSNFLFHLWMTCNLFPEIDQPHAFCSKYFSIDFLPDIPLCSSTQALALIINPCIDLIFKLNFRTDQGYQYQRKRSNKVDRVRKGGRKSG